MYSKVLVALDDSPCAAMALQHAVKVAAGGAKLLVVTVADIAGPTLAGALPGQRKDPDQAALAVLDKCHLLLKQTQEALAQQGITAKTLVIDLTESQNRNVAKAIVDEANEAGVDLIVMGTHARQGLQRFLLGSVAESVVRAAHCPVLLTPGASVSAFACLSPAEIYGQWPEDEKLQP